MQLTLTLNFFSSKKCDADDVKQPLVASIETQLCRTSDTIGMLTQFNYPHLQDNVRVGEHSVKFLCVFKQSFKVSRGHIEYFTVVPLG